MNLDDEVDAVLAGTVVVPLAVAWRLLGIKKSTGYALAAAGKLELLQVGGASKITTRSIKRYLRAAPAGSRGRPQRPRYHIPAANGGMPLLRRPGAAEPVPGTEPEAAAPAPAPRRGAYGRPI